LNSIQSKRTVSLRTDFFVCVFQTKLKPEKITFQEKEGKTAADALEAPADDDKKGEDDLNGDDSDADDLQKLEDEISDLKEEERKAAKRIKKKKLKEKRKTAERINLKVIGINWSFFVV
jgi:hypothetical protein